MAAWDTWLELRSLTLLSCHPSKPPMFLLPTPASSLGNDLAKCPGDIFLACFTQDLQDHSGQYELTPSRVRKFPGIPRETDSPLRPPPECKCQLTSRLARRHLTSAPALLFAFSVSANGKLAKYPSLQKDLFHWPTTHQGIFMFGWKFPLVKFHWLATVSKLHFYLL